MKKEIKDFKIDAVLNKKFNYPEGIMTRKEWCIMMKSKGATSSEKQERQRVKEEKEREELNYLRLQVPLGNSNYPTTKRYLERKAELEKGFFKTVYRLHTDDSGIWEITKIEFDFFNSLEVCADCGKEMDGTEHNYGTEDFMTCIHCYNDAQISAQTFSQHAIQTIQRIKNNFIEKSKIILDTTFNLNQ